MSKQSEIFVKIKMIEEGIVPAFTGCELSNLLKSLSPSERRKVKRKFRKIWKKMLKENPDLSETVLPDIGRKPGIREKRNRSVFVVREFINNYHKSIRSISDSS